MCNLAMFESCMKECLPAKIKKYGTNLTFLHIRVYPCKTIIKLVEEPQHCSKTAFQLINYKYSGTKMMSCNGGLKNFLKDTIIELKCIPFHKFKKTMKTNSVSVQY